MPYIVLRPVIDSDLPALFEFQCEPEGNAMAAFPAREREAFYAHWRKVLDDSSCTVLAVVVDGCLVGHIGSWSQADQRLVGYWLGQRYWGRGIATAALSLFTHQFTDRPLFAYVAKQNVASARVLEKCGFVQVADEVEELLYSLTDNTLSQPRTAAR